MMKLPKGWEKISGDAIAALITKGESPGWQGHSYQSAGVLFVTSENVRDGQLDISEPKFIPGEFHRKLRRSALKRNDILINLVGASIGRSCLFRPPVDQEANINQAVCLLRLNEGIDPQWVSLYLQEPGTVKRLIGNNGDSARANVSLGDIRNFQFLLPPLPEQRRIADILSTWDEALETLDALIAAKVRQKQALMQQLLTGKTRVKGAKGKWKIVSLSDMLVPITRTVQKPAGSFLAAGIRSHGKGVFLKPDFKPEDIALDELFEIKSGDLIVNITFAWEGAAAIVSEQADGALVSHRFPTFLFKDGIASCSFFRHYIRSKRFVFDCGLASPGGAGRNRVLSKSAFLDIELKAPPFEEQEQIGAILDTADQELTLLRRQREALDQQKRGLMQRLLTGKLRVLTS